MRAPGPSSLTPRIADVDNDPMVCSYVQALLATNERVQAAQADLKDASAVLGHQAVKAVIDPAEPACVIVGAAPNLMSAGRAGEVIAGYADLIAPGSYVAISSGRFDDQVVWKQVRAACTASSLRNHTRRQIEGFLAGLELVPAGLTAAQGWCGGWGDVRVTPPGSAYVLAGVARKR
jgi:hypothetical protein